MKILLLLFWVFMAQGYALNNYSVDEIRNSYKKGETDKFRLDNLPLLESSTLVKQGIFNSIEYEKPIKMSKEVCKDKLTSENDSKPLDVFNCKTNLLNNKYTSSLFSINLKNSTYQCAVAQNKYKPIGVYKLSIADGCKEFLASDKLIAKEEYKDAIENSEELYSRLYAQKKAIKDSITNYDGQNNLNVTDILLSAILSDVDIINMQGTKASNRIQLQDGFNSQITDPNSFDISSAGNGGFVNTTTNNSDFISAKASTIADVYAKLSDLSIPYLFMLIILFGAWGTGHKVLNQFFNKIEDKKDNDKNIPYIATILVGMMLFFPVGREDILTNANNGDAEEYSVMKSNYQNFERMGYYLFNSWATDTAEVIIDSEMDGLISSAGLSNTKDIIYNSSKKTEASKYFNVNRNIVRLCKSTYDTNLINQLMQDKTNVYPTSELSFYAENINNGNGAKYYSPIADGGIVKQYSNSNNQGTNYPDILLSACGKSTAKLNIFEEKWKDHHKALIKATTELNNPDNGKILIVKNLISFQYELLRDFGPLSILGLPVTILQTEDIGALKENDVKEKVSERGVIDEKLHSILSTIPYLLLPGVSNVYAAAEDNSLVLGGAAGAKIAVDTVDGNWIDDILSSVVGAAVGGAVGQFFGGAVALGFSYQAALTIIAIAPIVGILLMGTGRFIVILTKVFLFHFISLFILPLLFARHNTEAIASFTMKIIMTMFELPLFVLSIFIAMTAHNLLKIVGESIEERVIDGMIQNLITSDSSYYSILKVYFFDGLTEVGLAVFSLIVIWKIIGTTHTSVMEAFEVRASNSLDSALDAMAAENSKLKL